MQEVEVGILNFLASGENYYICKYILTNVKHANKWIIWIMVL